VKSGFRPLRQT